MATIAERDDSKTNVSLIESLKDAGEQRITGTVKLIEDGEIILIPAPTGDPQGESRNP